MLNMFDLLRFAGDEFPPYIVFKIFIQTNGKGMKYLCGKKVIKSSITVSVSYIEDFLDTEGPIKSLMSVRSSVCLSVSSAFFKMCHYFFLIFCTMVDNWNI